MGGRAIRAVVAAAVPVLLAGAAHAGLPQSAATVAVTPNRAGVRPAAITVRLTYEMQCGYPGPGPVRVVLPVAVRVPARIARSAVFVNGRAAPAVRVAGRAISVGLPARPRIMCDAIGPGRLTIVFGRAAGIGNPLRAGSYLLVATRQTSSFVARFTIRAA